MLGSEYAMGNRVGLFENCKKPGDLKLDLIHSHRPWPTGCISLNPINPQLSPMFWMKAVPRGRRVDLGRRRLVYAGDRDTLLALLHVCISHET